MRSWRRSVLAEPACARVPLVWVVAILCLPVRLAAQFDVEPTEFVFYAPAAQIPPSAELDNLFSRAAEAAGRSDWKLAIDCLQRIIEDPVGGLVEVPSPQSDYTRYESARRRALRELGTLPPEGLSAYRLLHDGKARRLVESARSAGDPVPLREVVDRYLLTSHGDDACDLLSSWALDEGRPREVIMVLSSLREFVPEYAEGVESPRDGIPSDRLATMLAAARAMVGSPSEAQRLAAASGTDRPWLQRLTSLAPRASAGAAPSGWSMSGGGADRAGDMAAISPTMQEMSLWQVDVPGVRADLWQSDTPRRLLDPDDLPVAAPLWYDGMVYVRTLNGVMAVDAESMGVVWSRSTRRDAEDSGGSRAPLAGRGVDPAQVEWDRLFRDHITGSISVAHDLVFVVELGGGRWQSQMNLLRPAWRGGFEAEWAVTHADLIAIDAKNGEVVWRRGARESAGEALGSVQFRAVPLAVGPHIWVPMTRGSDFLVAVFDPGDGALVQEIDLGWFSDADAPTDSALDLAATDGVVFVPSGQGVLYAVDALDFTPRWAVRYAEKVGRRLGGGAGDGWLSSPPVISGDRVILAPSGQNELLAFSIADGRQLWRTNKPIGARYVIGADAQRAWVGGTTVSCVTLEDGRSLWSHELSAAPSGRAVWCGDRVLAPTDDGLAVIPTAGAQTVERFAVENSNQPLGNLLSWDGSLFSLDPRRLQKFPDLATAYPRAVERWKQSPKDPKLAMRLGWLELFRQEPRAGYDVLVGIGEDAFAASAPGAAELSHLRVELLLARADRPGAAPDEVMALIEEAGRFSRRATDRLRVGVRAGRELASRGRGAEAFQGLLRLAVSADADRMGPAIDSVVAPERLRLAGELSAIASRLSKSDAEAVEALIDEEVAGLLRQLADPSTQGDVWASLDRIGHLNATGSGGQRALLALGLAERSRRRFEAAEYFLSRAAARDAAPDLTAAALMALADMYADPLQRMAGPSADRIDQAAQRFGSDRLPGVYTAVAGVTASREGQTIRDWSDAARRRLDPLALATERFDVARPGFLIRPGQLWVASPTTGRGGGRLVSFDRRRPAALAARAVFYEADDVLVCRDVRTQVVQWQTELRREQEFRSLGTIDLGIVFGEQSAIPGAHRAVADGQVMIIRSDQALHAVGLVTGRRLWVKAFDVPDSDPNCEACDYAMAAGDGVVAATPRSGRLTLLRTLDGSTIWETDLQGESADYVLLSNDRVIIVDGDHERVSLFDRGNGRRVARVLFRQPDSDHNVVELAHSGDLLIGPAEVGDGAVKAVDLSTGEVRWERKPAQSSGTVLLWSILQPKDDVIALGLTNGQVVLLDAAMGKEMGTLETPSTGQLYDAVLAGDQFITRHVDTESGINEATLTAYDFPSGKERWRREDLAPIELFDHALRVYGTGKHLIPMLIDVDRAAGRRRSGNFELQLIAARDGSTVGEGANVTTTGSGLSYVLDFDVWAEAMIVGMVNDLRGFGVTVGELP